MSTGLVLIAGPTIEPITRDEAKLYLRIDTTDEDELIDALITAARQTVENTIKQALICQTWEYFLDSLPYGKSNKWWDGVVEGPMSLLNGPCDAIEIPMAPLLQLNSFKTYSQSDVESEYDIDNLIVDKARKPGRLALKIGQVWPTDLRNVQAIRINFDAGYGDSAQDVPNDLIHAIKLLLGFYYENRCDDPGMEKLPMSVNAILSPYRIYRT